MHQPCALSLDCVINFLSLEEFLFAWFVFLYSCVCMCKEIDSWIFCNSKQTKPFLASGPSLQWNTAVFYYGSQQYCRTIQEEKYEENALQNVKTPWLGQPKAQLVWYATGSDQSRCLGRNIRTRDYICCFPWVLSFSVLQLEGSLKQTWFQIYRSPLNVLVCFERLNFQGPSNLVSKTSYILTS